MLFQIKYCTSPLANQLQLHHIFTSLALWSCLAIFSFSSSLLSFNLWLFGEAWGPLLFYSARLFDSYSHTWLQMPLGRAYPMEMGNRSRDFWVTESSKEVSGGNKLHFFCLLFWNTAITNQTDYYMQYIFSLPSTLLIIRESNKNSPWVSSKIKDCFKACVFTGNNCPFHF